MARKILFALFAVLLLSSCSSQNGGVKLDSLLDVANSSSGKNLSLAKLQQRPQSRGKSIA